jgi:hypothetical protein
MPIELIVKGDPAAQILASVLFGSAALCESYSGECSKCPGHRESKNSAGISSYSCRFGLYAEREAEKLKDEKVITEEDIAQIDVNSRNYAGREAGFTFEDIGIKLLLRPKSTQ